MLGAADEAHLTFEEIKSRAGSKNLVNFVPSGELILANAGHNGYTWGGKKIDEYTPHVIDKENGGKNELSLENLLMGSPIIGSSANLWVPSLTVQETKSSKPSQMPESPMMKILMYHKGQITPAQFNVETAAFQPFTYLVDSFSPEEVELLDSPKVHLQYAKNFHAKELFSHSAMPKLFRRIELFSLRLIHMPGDTGFFAYKALKAASALLSKATDHKMYNSYSNISQFLVNYYSPNVSLRWNIARKFLHKEPSEEAIAEYCYATKSEIQAVLQDNLAKVSRDIQLAYLNRFLLYKSFERGVADKDGHYLIGQITGDSQNIHMPYIKVGLRK